LGDRPGDRNRTDWPTALARLAEAGIAPLAAGEGEGRWGRLNVGAGQWSERSVALALAQVLGALHAAASASDQAAIGVVCWQLASVAAGQGDYLGAAERLRQAQEALERAGLAPRGGILAAAAQLCLEIERWQRAGHGGPLAGGEISRTIGAARDDLFEQLNEAARLFRELCAAHPPFEQLADFLASHAIQEPAGRPPAGDQAASLRERFARWWRVVFRAERMAGAVPTAGDGGVTPEAPLAGTAAVQPVLSPGRGDADGEQASQTPAVEPAPGAVPAIALAGATPELRAELVPPVHRAGLAVYMFGELRIYFDDILVDRWESTRARALFRYLIANRRAAAAKERLAAQFWPDSEPELARRSLHQAIYCLRQTLKRYAGGRQIIQFANDHYQIASDVPIWVDVEEFEAAIAAARSHWRAGDVEVAVHAYATAVDLYLGDFLAEDRYEQWAAEQHGALQVKYLEALQHMARYYHERDDLSAAIMLCQRALAHDSCDEDAHRTLMACYMAQGLRHLAVRQHRLCVNALRSQLGLEPSAEFEAFYREVVIEGNGAARARGSVNE
jgi:DNA-binding SARP family transcriptional activator